MNHAICPSETLFPYAVAGETLASTFPIRSLAPFSCVGSPTGYSLDIRAVTSVAPHIDDQHACFDDTIQLGSTRYRLQAEWRQQDSCQLQIRRSDGHRQVFVIGRSGIRVSAGSVIDSPDELVLLGPALTVALVLRGVFLLHASAVVLDGTLCVFLGESGVGKSTLAAALHSAGARRVTDDLLPVRLHGKRIEARPAFPQWKLPPGEQPRSEKLPRWQRLRWFFITPQPADDEVSVEPLSAAECLLQLARHTVASRLLSPHWLKKHQQACQVAAGLPGARLRYPHRHDAFAEVARKIRRYLSVPSARVGGA